MDKKGLEIIPNGELVIKSMRTAIIIIGIILAISSVLISLSCQISWLKWIAVFSLLVNILYLMLSFRITAYNQKTLITNTDCWLVYLSLILAALPTLLVLLCGADYLLYEILGVYILLDADKLVFPIMSIAFLSITYWLPVKAIQHIQLKQDEFYKLKKAFYNVK